MAAIYLKKLPDDILKYVLKIQGQTKAEKGLGQYSLELTVYSIIKDHKKLTEK